MLLDGHDRAARGGALDAVAVDRPDGREVEDSRADAVRGEQLGGVERPGHRHPGRDDRDVGSVAQRHRPADLELRVSAVHVRHGHAADTEEDRAVQGGGGAHRLRGLDRSRRAR